MTNHLTVKNKLIVALISFIAVLVLTSQSASANYPHLPEFGVDCWGCHFAHGGMYPDDTDCLACHDGSTAAPKVVGHSSATTSNKYGAWSVTCDTCHDGMYQWQFREYGPDAYIFSGTSDLEGITETTLTMSGANWTPDEFAGYQLIPNLIVDDTYSYRILGNTTDTITVNGPIFLESVTTGNTSFAVIYGRLIKTTIATPNSGPKPVKFFDYIGPNSFADGDQTYDGVCEVCHTMTNHHQNDGNAPGDLTGHNDGRDCTECHRHDQGFRASCNSCHNYPPTTGSHLRHLNPVSLSHVKASIPSVTITCLTCHNNNNHNNGVKDVAEGSLYKKIDPWPMTFSNGICSGACHSGAVWGGAPLVCYDCHDHMNYEGDYPPVQAAPQIVAHTDILSMTRTLVTFQWAAVPPAYGSGSYTEYLVEVKESAPNSTPIQSGWITGTSWSTQLDTVKSWTWTVTARDAARPHLLSAVQTSSFNIAMPGAPSIPTITPEPDINVGQPTNVTVAWLGSTDPEGDPVQYLVEVSTASNFTINKKSSGWISGTQYTFTSAGCEGLYWRVRSRDAVHNVLSPWSSVDYFQDLYNCGGSCPFLYVWDGEKFDFGTDLNGPGKLATQSSSGYFKPNPNDYYVLQTEPVKTKGHYEMRLVEERFEVNYLDQLRFFAVDIPEDRQLFAEKPGFTTPFNGLESHLHTASMNPGAPLSVVHVNTGLDVSAVTATSDGDFLELNLDRNVGFSYQTIELDLGDLSAAPQIKLILDGLSAFPDTPEGTANAASFGPRTKLEVLDANGAWVRVPSSNVELPKLPEFNRPFALDITNIFVSDTYKVRLTFLFKTYVDSILIDTTLDEPLVLTEMQLSNAELRSYGHSEPIPLIDDIYEYLYRLDDPNHEHDYYPGSYTRYGNVKPLLNKIDDQFVIYGSGDELVLRFKAPNKVAKGVKKNYIIYSNSYYKDAKSGIPATVEPLPFAAMSNFPYNEDVEHYPDSKEHNLYREKYNTRTVDNP